MPYEICMYIYVKYYRKKDYVQTIEGGGIDEVMMMMMVMKVMTMVKNFLLTNMTIWHAEWRSMIISEIFDINW